MAGVRTTRSSVALPGGRGSGTGVPVRPVWLALAGGKLFLREKVREHALFDWSVCFCVRCVRALMRAFVYDVYGMVYVESLFFVLVVREKQGKVEAALSTHEQPHQQDPAIGTKFLLLL